MSKYDPPISELIKIRRTLLAAGESRDNDRKLRAINRQVSRIIRDGKSTCPHGHMMGASHDRHAECDQCKEDVYALCGDALVMQHNAAEMAKA